MFMKKVECPRCHKIWTLPQYSPGVECNCHLWCPDGNKQSDCALTDASYSGTLKWPVGLDLGDKEEGSDVLHRTYYCSVHKRYSYREPIFLEGGDNKVWQKQRKLPSKMRELQTR